MKKRKIVLSDKAKIASVIAELDEKKNEALKKAYEQVNKVGWQYLPSSWQMFFIRLCFWMKNDTLEELFMS